MTRRFVQAWLMIEDDKVTVLTPMEIATAAPAVETPSLAAPSPIEVRPQRASPTDHSYDIMQAFEGETRPLHISVIAKRCGIANHSTCSGALIRMIDERILKRWKKGWYYDPKKWTPPLTQPNRTNAADWSGLAAH